MFTKPITRPADPAQEADPQPAEQLLPLVYAELRRLARHLMARESATHTLEPTALVHEAWLRVAQSTGLGWNSRNHFFMAAATAMRRILIERARRRQAAKRGSGQRPLHLGEWEIPSPAPDDDQLLAVHEALEKLALVDLRKAQLVKLRYFVGLNFEETAAALGIAVPTAKQWWAYARAWLTVELRTEGRRTEAPNPH